MYIPPHLTYKVTKRCDLRNIRKGYRRYVWVCCLGKESLNQVTKLCNTGGKCQVAFTEVSRFSTALSAVCSSLDRREECWLRDPQLLTPPPPSATEDTWHKNSWQQNRFRKLILNIPRLEIIPVFIKYKFYQPQPIQFVITTFFRPQLY